MSESWPGMTGNRHLVRIGTRAADEGTCPDNLAAKALPAVWPAAAFFRRGSSSWTTSRWVPSWTRLTTSSSVACRGQAGRSSG